MCAESARVHLVSLALRQHADEELARILYLFIAVFPTYVGECNASSVLQEVKGLTKKLYFVILLVGRPVTRQTFRLNVRFTCFDIGTACIIMYC